MFLIVLFNTFACLLHMKETVLRSWKLLVSVILPIHSGIFLFVRSHLPLPQDWRTSNARLEANSASGNHVKAGIDPLIPRVLFRLRVGLNPATESQPLNNYRPSGKIQGPSLDGEMSYLQRVPNVLTITYPKLGIELYNSQRRSKTQTRK